MVRYTNHAKDNMLDRGATEWEVAETIRNGTEVSARQPALGRALVFRNGYFSNGRRYPHKEVHAIYVIEDGLIVVLTVIVRYGFWEIEE